MNREASVGGGSVQAELSGVFRRSWGQFKQEMQGRLSGLGLSNLQARALMQLDGPMTMRQLADAVGTEPSNLTPIVDRLEVAGLVQRRAMPGDRRVRQLCVTPSGADIRARVGSEVFASMTLFDRLDVGEQRQLLALLEKLTTPPPPC